MVGTGARKGYKLDLIRKRDICFVSGMINVFMTGLNNAREPLGGLFRLVFVISILN